MSRLSLFLPRSLCICRLYSMIFVAQTSRKLLYVFYLSLRILELRIIIFFNKPYEFLLYETNGLHFSVHVYCIRSQKTSQRTKNNSHTTRLRRFITVHFIVIYYSTHAR